MATVSGTGASTGTGTTTSQSKTVSDSKSIANNFDQFLLLLTTQLKNQNPLDPMDSNQFTSQLVQFASPVGEHTTAGHRRVDPEHGFGELVQRRQAGAHQDGVGHQHERQPDRQHRNFG